MGYSFGSGAVCGTLVPGRLSKSLNPAKVIVQSRQEVLHGAEENSIAGQSAIVKNAVGEISNKPVRVGALDAQREFDCCFNRLMARHFQQHDRLAVRVCQGFDLGISRRELD